MMVMIMADTFTYHGKKVVINQPEEHIMHDAHETLDTRETGELHGTLLIDDADIHIMTLQDGTFATHYFPYWSYDSLEKLARDLVDKVPEFGPHLIKREGD
jgi:hypothetical protein